MSRSRPVSLALVGLFVCVTACSTYTQIEIGEVSDHHQVRVTTTDGERETIRDPRVEAESIVGDKARAIPLDQVIELEAVGTNEVAMAFLGTRRGANGPASLDRTGGARDATGLR